MATQRTVLITGCSAGGIGHSLALEFASQDFHVFATARRLSSMESLSANPNITLLQLDVTSTASIENAKAEVTKATGGTLDIIYHNAGVRSIVMAIHSGSELAEKTFQANFFAIVEMNRIFMPLILKAAPGSKIVFSNSVAAVVPIPTQSMYDASKAALHMYAKVLGLELSPLGIHVVNVITGEVGTLMAEGAMEELPKGSPYQPIKAIIDKVWKVRSAIMPVGEYSQYVVQKVIQNAPPKQIWRGANASMIWFIDTFGLQWMYGVMFRKQYGLDTLKPSVY